jgi:NADH:ubiquinone oxidoreductase subunit K
MVRTLLSLEFASVSLYLILFLILRAFPRDLFISLVYLTLAACEGALGLSILVVIIKYRGNDYSKINNIPQC